MTNAFLADLQHTTQPSRPLAQRHSYDNSCRNNRNIFFDQQILHYYGEGALGRTNYREIRRLNSLGIRNKQVYCIGVSLELLCIVSDVHM